MALKGMTQCCFCGYIDIPGCDKCLLMVKCVTKEEPLSVAMFQQGNKNQQAKKQLTTEEKQEKDPLISRAQPQKSKKIHNGWMQSQKIKNYEILNALWCWIKKNSLFKMTL